MKRLSLVTLLASTFVLTLAAGGTAYAGKRHHHCCQGFAACNAVTIVWGNGPADVYKVQKLSLCYKCQYPFADID